MKKTAKQRRDLLFKEGLVDIRKAEYNDIRWFWAAAKKSGFEGTAEEFTDQAEEYLSQVDAVWMIEDRNVAFKSCHGPTGVVVGNYDGWSLVPHVEWFQWAGLRNKLRGTVGFLQMFRNSRDVGVIKITASEDDVAWFKRLKTYLSIHYVGRIPGGSPQGNEHIFYLRGRKNGKRNRRVAGRIEGKEQEHVAQIPEAPSGSA